MTRRALTFLAVLLAVSLSGCGTALTVAPSNVSTKQASWDGGSQNSGIIESIPGGFIVTPHFLARYAALVDKYGRNFVPRLVSDEGITTNASGDIIIDAEHMTYFLRMNAWEKSGIAPYSK